MPGIPGLRLHTGWVCTSMAGSVYVAGLTSFGSAAGPGSRWDHPGPQDVIASSVLHAVPHAFPGLRLGLTIRVGEGPYRGIRGLSTPCGIHLNFALELSNEVGPPHHTV